MVAVWSIVAGLALLQPPGDAAAPVTSTSVDWPQWRGPKRDGICRETGLLSEWPENGPPVLWTAKDRGIGYSTPTITGGKIFGMGSRDGDELVWALDEATGKELWTARVGPNPGGRSGGGYEGPRCSPTVDGDRVYAVGIQGDLICVSADSGKQLWKVSYPTLFKGRMMSGWGFSESPLVDDNRVIVTPGGDDAAMVALKPLTGEVIWKAQVSGGGGAAYSSVMPATVGKTKVYMTLLGRKLVGVAATDGKLLFEYAKVANSTANIPTVIVRDQHVFCSTGYTQGGSALLKLEAKPDGGVSANEVWYKDAKGLQNHHGGAVLIGDHLYLGHGHSKGFPVCVEFLTGEFAWGPDRGPGGGGGSAALLAADGHLYYRYENGVMALIEASPKERKVKSTFKLPNQSGKPSWPHPVIVHGKMYIRDQDKLTCFDVKKKSN